LNIWSPNKGQGKKAVLLYAYGGGFETGSTLLYYGSKLANRGDVVVVSTG
jgi:carboxylesterase type B